MPLNPKRKAKKIYRTTIKLTAGQKSSEPGREPQIEIDTETLKPKMIKPKFKPLRPEKRRDLPRLPSGEKPFKVAKRYDEALIQQREWLPVTKKTKWKCIRCGWCCSHEWRVNLTWDEYDRLRFKLPIDKVVLDEVSGMSHPFYMIKDKCAQYDPKKHKCKIYKERAYSCATYPFSITPDGKLVRSKFCKGFGNGNLIDKKKMVRYIYKWRKQAGMCL